MTITTDYAPIACAVQGCGVLFFVSAQYDGRRRADHSDFHCPNGHVLSYPGETVEAKLRRELRHEKTRALTLQDEITALKRPKRKPRKKTT